MSDHGYDTGRLNLPVVGVSTFAKSPDAADRDATDADAAVLGAPDDFGARWRAGARFGPRAIRKASTLFPFGRAGAYDREDGATDREGVRIVDAGDADIVRTDAVASHAAIGFGVRRILAAGALPVVLGGDHSVNIPRIAAFDGAGPIHVVQVDAHPDCVDGRHGARHGHPMRRAAETAHVAGPSQFGIRTMSSTAKDGDAAARAMDSGIPSVRPFRRLGTEATLGRVPAGARHYLTLDIDGFDPSLAAGTGTPSHGGFPSYEVLDLVAGPARRGTIVGLDLVEVAPDDDRTGTTAIPAARILPNAVGRIFHTRR